MNLHDKSFPTIPFLTKSDFFFFLYVSRHRLKLAHISWTRGFGRVVFMFFLILKIPLMMKSHFFFFVYDVTEEIGPYHVNGWIRVGCSYIFLDSHCETFSKIALLTKSVFSFVVYDDTEEIGPYFMSDWIQAQLFLYFSYSSYPSVLLFKKSRTKSWVGVCHNLSSFR